MYSFVKVQIGGPECRSVCEVSLFPDFSVRLVGEGRFFLPFFRGSSIGRKL